ncbi:uncharacterized protein BJ212DRAFT_1343519 [Suillus subaureus]|uniref:Uncharacterized protein n=1 Tax=Suillus subaureus TaxID=48587 RepID=A0A9P7EF28_9AGAM|nr:uncharacterized protein BJ212DRAFT_1343519 [Suillus subaureus]KAG1819859.1 hypothetical protein BJ212DRAFT_1343519 [Suillus subaureus]
MMQARKGPVNSPPLPRTLHGQVCRLLRVYEGGSSSRYLSMPEKLQKRKLCVYLQFEFHASPLELPE